MGKRLELYYDREADVLYFSRGKPSAQAISREIGDDIVVRLEPGSNEVEGVTILNVAKRFERSKRPQTIAIDAEFALI